jgi:hypothetical protein
MNKKLLILSVIIVILLISGAILLNIPKRSSATMVDYNNAGLSFKYYNSWKISESKKDNNWTLSFTKSQSSSIITIELHELPISYENYTFQQITDALKLKIETDNKNWINVFSGSTKIGKSDYLVRQLLYESKDDTRQNSVIIGKSGTKLFAVAMESNRNEFDLISHDLDTITDSIDVK